MKNKILSIDDDRNFLVSIKNVLELEDYDVTTISNSQKVLDVIQNEYFDVILLDVKMPGLNGLELFDLFTEKIPGTPVIMISGESNINTAVDVIKKGVYDFIEKPLDPDYLLSLLEKVFRKKKPAANDDSDSQSFTITEFIGNSPAIKKVFNEIEKVAPTEAKILLYGESGTGKELAAWAIHKNSKRKDKPYIKVNCAAIPSELLESELFGHKKGSYTGATEDREGKFAAANGGTLLLDEIGDMSLTLQSKLLRVLEESEIEIIGESIPRKIDVRIIAATNQSLEEKVIRREFREDLYHRLNVIKIVIPPLRDRRNDIIPLVEYYIEKFNKAYGRNINKISKQAEGALLNYSWKGNVRELKNIIEKIVIFSQSDEITITDVLNALSDANQVLIKNEIDDSITLQEARDQFEREFIINALEKNNWKIEETANSLGIDRSNLFRKMKKYEIESD
ncbi:Response regulator of zinc sigma-54-dependent two-component system [hydrothermal vent metagenome]|uniref:Response regulator of zinc sigma-54-dependent two-component system n=1 Tax=hydrothermal vent metagenome TaxID=652676 RepID=A0A3B1CQ05_9ZZZZ